MSYALLTVVGNLGSVDILTSRAGNKYVRMSVAVNYGRGNNRTVTWYNLLLFGKAAEGMDERTGHYTVGRKVAASGRPQIEPFIKKDGSPGSDNSIILVDWPELLD